MEIPIDIFNHLAQEQYQLFKDDPSLRQVIDRNSIILDKPQQQFVESGIIFSQYLLKLNQIRSIKDLNVMALQNLKNSHQPASKLYNWNTISKEVERLGVTIDSDKKSLLVAGEPETLVDLLQQIVLYDKRGNQKQVSNKALQKRGPSNEQPIDIVSLKSDKSLQESGSTLEYIILSLCQALQLQPKQAAGLLTNHNQYLFHACIKGVKGNYDGILAWYQLLYSSSKHLASLLNECFVSKEQTAVNSGYMLLNALKSGFYSTNQTICEWTIKLFSRIAQDFTDSQSFEYFFQWYITVPSPNNQLLGGGLESTLFALQKHTGIVESISLLINVSFKGNFKEKFIEELRTNHFKEESQMLKILNELLPFLYKQNKDEIQNDFLIESGLIEECIRSSDSTNADNMHRSECLSFLTEVWLLDQGLIQDNQHTIDENHTLLQSTMKIFKRGCRDKDRPLRLSALGLMFRLLDQFAQVKNQQAPVLYKILTFSLIENSIDDITREFMMTNFSEIFQHHQSIPVGILIDPLLRIMQNEQAYLFNVFDFDFFVSLAKHPKLQLAPHGIQLIDQLAKIYLSSPLWASAASVPFLLLSDRYQQDPNFQDFLLKFCSITLTSILQMKKQYDYTSNNKKSKSSTTSSVQGDGALANEDENLKKIRRNNIVEIIKKLCNLKIGEDFNEQIKEIILTTNRKHKQLFGYFNKGLLHLLELWYPKGKTAMEDYIKQQDLNEVKLKTEEEKKLKKSKQDEQKKIQAKLQQQQQDQETMEEGDLASDASINKNNGKLVPYINTLPKNPIEKKAFQDLELIKQKRDEKILRQKLEEEKKVQKDRKTKNQLKDLLTKRKIELGIIKQSPDQEQALVLYQPSKEIPEEDEDDKPSQKTSGTTKIARERQDVNQIKLLDLDEEEEDRDKDGVKLILLKYSKLFKFLFNKYAMSRSQHKKIQEFEYYGDKTINIAEINKLLKDHDIHVQIVNKDQLTTIVRLLNVKHFKRNDLTALDFNGFMDFIAQISFFIFSKPPLDYRHLSLPEMIMRLIQLFEKATRSRGHTTLLYEDPDATTIGDQELLKEMNRRVKENPDYSVPESFFKVVEKDQIFKYNLPSDLDIDQSQRIVIETVDQFLYDLFNFHFIEPLVTYEQKVKVKPRIKQTNIALGPPSAVSYMQPIDRKLKPIGYIEPSQQQQKQVAQLDQVQYKRPNLGVELKIQVLEQQKLNPQSKNIILETAEALEEILQAVDLGLDFLPERKQAKVVKEIWNKAKEQKLQKEQEEKELKRVQEEKRKKRKAQLDGEIIKTKQIREQELEEQKKKKLEQDQKQKQQEKKEKEDRSKKLEERKKVVQVQEKQKTEDTFKSQQEEEEKKLKEKQEKSKGQKEFLAKQKEKLGQEFEKKKQDKEESDKALVELEKWKKEKLIEQKKAMEEYLKQNQETTKVELKERQEIDEFFNSQDVQSVFQQYDRPLEQIFKFFASQDKKEISYNLAQNLQRVNFNEYIKFGFQTNITNTIIPNDDMVHIFRAIVRERRDKMSQQEIDQMGQGFNSLTLEDFKKALIRIAIMAQDILGGQQGERLEDMLMEPKFQKPPKIMTKRTRGQSLSKVNTQAQNSSRQSRQNFRQNSLTGIEEKSQINTTRQNSTSKKTKEQRILEDIQKEKERFEKQVNFKIQEKRLTKPLDVSIITAPSIEGLIKYIQNAPLNVKYDQKEKGGTFQKSGAPLPKSNKANDDLLSPELDEIAAEKFEDEFQRNEQESSQQDEAGGQSKHPDDDAQDEVFNQEQNENNEFVQNQDDQLE